MSLDQIPREHSTARSRLRSRRPRACDARSFYGCSRTIERGDTYDRITVFPGHDANGSDRPYPFVVCAACVDWTWGDRVADVMAGERP